jgi:hypothetical protein
MSKEQLEYRQPKNEGCIICGDDAHVANPFRFNFCTFHTDRALEADNPKVFLENHGFSYDQLIATDEVQESIPEEDFVESIIAKKKAKEGA